MENILKNLLQKILAYLCPKQGIVNETISCNLFY